jgi:hypothetical protein
LAGICKKEDDIVSHAWTQVTNQGNSVWTKEMARLFTVFIAVKVGFPRVTFEGDAKLVFSPLVSPNCEPPWQQVSSILDDISSFGNSFVEGKFSIVRRDLNSLAHCVGQGASFCKREGSDRRSLFLVSSSFWGPHGVHCKYPIK